MINIGESEFVAKINFMIENVNKIIYWYIKNDIMSIKGNLW